MCVSSEWFPAIFNAGKYASAIATVILNYLKSEDKSYEKAFILMHLFSTLYNLFWEYKVDWGLLQSTHKT